MEQVEVVEKGAAHPKVERERTAGAEQPIEVFLSAAGRLQITADVDRAGIDTLIDMLEKYKGILELVGAKPN